MIDRTELASKLMTVAISSGFQETLLDGTVVEASETTEVFLDALVLVASRIATAFVARLLEEGCEPDIVTGFTDDMVKKVSAHFDQCLTHEIYTLTTMIEKVVGDLKTPKKPTSH